MPDMIYRERIVSTDPRLKRNINHDSRSRRYAFDTTGLTLVSVKHTRHIGALDQLDVGACTGFAGIGCLASGLHFYERLGNYSLDASGALRLYSEATHQDPFEGSYPPTDTGSDGLTIAKVLTAAGEISGYQHTFSLDDALKALTTLPYITGTYWLTGMFDPDPDGRVRLTGSIAGGHEYLAEELDVEQERVWFTNSWGPSWGVEGRFWMSWDDYGALLGRQGDVTIFVPRVSPAPVPDPAPVLPDPEDVALVKEIRGWANKRHYRCSNVKAAAAIRRWMLKKNLS